MGVEMSEEADTVGAQGSHSACPRAAKDAIKSSKPTKILDKLVGAWGRGGEDKILLCHEYSRFE
jgi:hypothetical protein